MNSDDAIIFVVDDDPSVRIALDRLIKSLGFTVRTFDTALSFLSSATSDAPCCLILDIRMPHMSGMELQEEMGRRGLNMPIIFITGHGTISMSVRAMKGGATDFLEKPFEEQHLLDTMQAAIEKDRQSKRKQSEIRHIQERADLLTSREREVFLLVVAGRMNKQIADELGVSEKTVKAHRAHMMEKMKAESLAALVRMAELIGIFREPD
jgi:RNA polymerase sigma factor (sigma-70 family)